ncbi:SusD-like starch-binding protein associating with outer membrane [Chitinophaga niastensis]|uniref:SusD-like starch-binding protein associating with outer membrane n=1 Tax=Chitinophaga niastensis TaxID=536980 RepID=A0A2P8HP10_CHINA|nr:RagB/SusD family nutrient uptake outer membrane protein [Chitinophaga niastensis]PSL47956.1 SusD-like starch-binding protein associating with outer membrane [Chitinophaga niastensis]
MKQFTVYITTGLISMALFASCTKDFLDKKPVSDALPEKMKSAEALLQGAYDNLYDEYYTSDFVVNGDVMSDNCYAGGDNAANFSIDKYTVNSANGNLKRDWNYLYTDIKNCNLVLSFVPTMKDPKLTDERMQQILGEASFLRAWHYFNLIRTWKEVPVVMSLPTDVTGMFSSKKSAGEVYAFIIKDLEFALSRVRATVPDKGQVSKGCVNALLAKVYAQQPTPDWNKVVTYCDAVTALGYDLVPDFASLFQVSGKNSIESIWETQNDGVIHQNWLTGMTTPWMWGNWKKFHIPAHALVNAWDAEGDAIRKNASIQYVTTPWTDDYWPQPVPVINKYPDGDGKSDTYRLRYADILLLKAEALTALNKLDNSVNGAQYYINKIRNRAKLGNTPANTQAALQLAVEKERQLELAFEGHRMYDLIRTNRAVAVMNAVKDGNGNLLNYNVTADKLYFPISQDEIDNNPNINK